MSSSHPALQDYTSSAYEEEHVHEVYESIASHFSQTRHKPWPIVANFLESQPIGSIGLDLGSGNGKYLHGQNITNISPSAQNRSLREERSTGLEVEQQPRYLLIGLDRSVSLLSLSRNPHSLPELLHGDCLSLPFRSTYNFDFAICIAAIHHLSTPERRLEAMKYFLSAIKPTSPSRVGRGLVFVWAHEQGGKSRRNWTKGTLLPAPTLLSSSTIVPKPDIKGVEELSKLQDVLVPWVLNKDSNKSSSQSPRTYNRYYHLFREGELIELVKSAAQLLKLSFEFELSSSDPSSDGTDWCLIKQHGWEADNWWVEIELGCAQSSSNKTT